MIDTIDQMQEPGRHQLGATYQYQVQSNEKIVNASNFASLDPDNRADGGNYDRDQEYRLHTMEA